jgi:acetylornithine deacetylase
VTALPEELATRILASVEEGFEEEVAFTEALVRHASRRGAERPAQDAMAEAFRARAWAVETLPLDVEAIRDHPGFSPVTVSYEDAVSVIATHEPRRATGRSLILNGHMDVVPEGPAEMWTRPPYEPRREGDWLYGRGAGDMKAGLAANLFAMDALARIGLQPAARVILQSVVEEECTGNGALHCLVAGHDAEAVLIPEPEDERLVRANVGVLWFAVHLRGTPVHVREAGTGTSAIEAAPRVIAALRDLEARWNEERRGRPFVEDEPHPINFNVGRIEGGDWASSVAAWCRLDCRIAIYPGDEPAERASELEAHLRDALAGDPVFDAHPPRLEWNGFFAKGYVQEPGSEAEAALARAHAHSTHTEMGTLVTPGYLDARVFAIYGQRPCLVYGPVAERIHGFDERVSLPSLKRVTGTIALFLAEWCGTEPIRQ